VLSDVDARNGWTLAEQAGHGHPGRLQSLLGSAVWDADELRDRLRDYAVYEPLMRQIRHTRMRETKAQSIGSYASHTTSEEFGQ
jgi:hypothetical protein